MDIENYLGQVWNPEVRPLAYEAWRCYNVGAVRASIALTWTAVTADIMSKIVLLADEGDPQAAPFRTRVANARASGISRQGVQAMQKVEEGILDEAAKFELVDSIGTRELERIKQDRNLCVHPSLGVLGDVYNPRPEMARAHLAVALSTLLVHPPTQGQKAIEAFTAYVCDPYFVPAEANMQATFFDRVRVATRRNIVKIAAKHALEAVPPTSPVHLPAAELADRMANALRAFASRDRELVRTVVLDMRSRFQSLDSETQLRCLVRLADQDYFWSMIDDAMAGKFNEMLSSPITIDRWDPLPPDMVAFLALVRIDLVRARLPVLERHFRELDVNHRMAIAEVQTDPYFVSALAEFLGDAKSFRAGERAGQILVRHASLLSIENLIPALKAWIENAQCRAANLMPGLAANLYRSTVHLGAARVEVFKTFLADAKAAEGATGYYDYPDLEAALRSDGFL